MREIKFRGKSYSWHYGDLIHDSCNGRELIFIDNNAERTRHSVDKDTVGQFTGLLDSARKEIYEGDIVRFELPPMVLTNEKTAIGVVVYEYGQFLVIIHAMRFTIFSVINDCTVISNVHDNPELLERML